MKFKDKNFSSSSEGAVLAEAAFSLLLLLLLLQVMVQYALAVRDRNEIQKAMIPAIRILSSERDLCLSFNEGEACEADEDQPFCCESSIDTCNLDFKKISSHNLILLAESWVDFVLNKGNASGSIARNYGLYIGLTQDSNSILNYSIAIKDCRGHTRSGDILGLRKAASFASAIVPIHNTAVSCLTADQSSSIITDLDFIEDAKEHDCAQ